MRLWECRLMFFILSVVRLACSQLIGGDCIRQDKSRGVCRDLQDCVGNGQLENAKRLDLCPGTTLGRVVVCCRRTPEVIASEKCNEWKREARRLGACHTFIPLARGGSEADVGEFPHMVSIVQFLPGAGGPTHRCGGVLISERYVLTAAHCIDNRAIYVRLGGHNLQDDEGRIAFDSEVISPIIHDQYQPPRKYNDIALLKLRITVPLSKRILPACLPYKNQRASSGAKMVVAGWGAYDGSGQTSSVLRKAEVTVIDRFRCDSNPHISNNEKSRGYPVGILDSIICADETESGACTGDSGGPLMAANSDPCGVKEVVGLVSRGIPECKRSNVPGTYTRIEFYLDWIVGVVWANEL